MAAVAGLLDDQDPETAIRREASEELGVTIGALTHIYDIYMSPGSVTERLHFYAAPYDHRPRPDAGGGTADEGQDIEVLELDYDTALSMIHDGRIADGKTIMLLYWAAADGPFRRARHETAAQGQESALTDSCRLVVTTTRSGNT